MSQTYPQRFGKYVLLNSIARGGMAEIFRGKTIGAEGFEREVVIKRILPHFTEDEAFVNMFIDEATLAAKLSHANVVQIFDFDRVDDTYYIAMEYVEGMDLRRVISRSQDLELPLPMALCLWIIIEAGKGLHYAHTRKHKNVPLKIVHRDVSPHNIMVSFNGEVKIMDFGIAKAASRSTSTRAGTVKGKCAYMSPEQARGEELDGRSDLFSLTVVLWEILTSQRLFASESDFEALRKVNDCEVEKPSTINPEVPEALDEIIMKSLSRDQDDRYANVGEFVEELQRYFYTTVTDSAHASLIAYMRSLFDTDIEKLEDFKAQEPTGYSDSVAEGLTATADDQKQPSGQHDSDDMNEATTALLDGEAPASQFDRTLTDPSQLRTREDPHDAPTTTDSSAHAIQELPADAAPPGRVPRMAAWILLFACIIAGVFLGPKALEWFNEGTADAEKTSGAGGADPGTEDIEEIADGLATVVFNHNVAGATIMVNETALEGNEWRGQPGTFLWVHLLKDNRSGPPLTVEVKEGRKEVALSWLGDTTGTVSIRIDAPDDVFLLIGGEELGPGMVLYQRAHLNDEIKIKAYRQGGEFFQRKLTITRNGQSFVIDAKEVPVVRPIAVVTLKLNPADALLKIDGENVEVVDGTVTRTGYRVGDQLAVFAEKDGYQKYEKRLPVTKTKMVAAVKLKKIEPTGFGYLSIDAVPWADVYLKGNKLGTTPIRNKQVRAGTHRLMLKNDQKTKYIHIKVRRGETTVPKPVQM